MLLTVIVPKRRSPAFAVAFILNEPLPVWVPGVMFETVSQLLLLVVTVQPTFDVTFTAMLPADAPGDHELCDIVSAGGGGGGACGVTGTLAIGPFPSLFTARTRRCTCVPFVRFGNVCLRAVEGRSSQFIPSRLTR